VTSSRCTSQYCKKKKSYNSDESKNFKKVGLEVEVEFGSGSVDGEINEDQFKLGDLIIPSQKFGEILVEHGDVFDSNKFSGILGLAYPGMSANGFTPVWDNIINSKKLQKNIISFYYSNDEAIDGQITIGYIDDTKYTGDIKYHKVIEKYYWDLRLDDIKYNGKSLGLCDGGCKVVADTGTAMITAPTSDFMALEKVMPVDDNCNGYELAGDLTFVIEGVEYSLQAEDYILKTDLFGVDRCRSMVSPLDIDPPRYIYF
jgi:cathepsin D